MARKTYRVNADSWTTLRDILCNPADEFNPDLSRRWTNRGSWSGWSYTGALRGRRVEEPSALSTGKLDGKDREQFEKDRIAIDYVIYSYETPIAWHTIDSEQWVMPDTRYSVTTSKQQGKVRTALSQIAGGI